MSQKRKLFSNSLSMLINKLTQGISTFVLTAAIGRNLGAYSLGQYLLAVSYYYIFVNIASQGFRTLFTRELAREPEKTPLYLVSGTLLQFVFSILGYLALVVVVYLLPYRADTSLMCYITGLTIIPFALSNVTEAILQAQEKMHLITISTVPIYILRLLAMLWVMHLNYGVKYVAGILVFSESLIWVIQWIILTIITKPQWQIQKDFMWRTTKAARTFFAIEGTGILASKINLLLLSLLGSEFLVGLYGAVGQLMQPFSIVATSLIIAAFPSMSKSVNLGREKQREVTENLLEMLLCMALPFCVGLFFLGEEILLFIYKDTSFSQATIVLYILSLTLITFTFIKVLGYLLVANNFEKFNLIEVVVTTVVGGLSGVVLISEYKLLGAALMDIVMALTGFGLLIYAVYTRLFSLRLWRLLRRPLLLTSLIAVVFMILRTTSINFIFSALIATVAYSLLAGLMIVRELGGWHYVMQKISIQKK